jgi:hypothetical protein
LRQHKRGIEINLHRRVPQFNIILLNWHHCADDEGVYDEVVDAKYQEPILYPFDLEGATPEHYEQLQKSLRKFKFTFRSRCSCDNTVS